MSGEWRHEVKRCVPATSSATCLGPMLDAVAFTVALDGPADAPVRCALRVCGLDAECTLIDRVLPYEPRRVSASRGTVMCAGDLSCTCHECCPDSPAILVFFHCSGRLKMEPVAPGTASTVINHADDLVSRQVGGARHHLLRLNGETLLASSSRVEPAEHLLVVLHGANFHLSPLCSGSIATQFPLPRYASGWLDVETTPASISEYVDAVLPDGSAPPIPATIYALAFSMRHDVVKTPDLNAPPPATAANLLMGATGWSEVATGCMADGCAVAGAPAVTASVAAAAAPSPLKRAKSKLRRAAGAAAAMPAMGMCGFDADECALLLENGARPWDDDAEEVLAKLRRRLAAGGTLV